MTAREGHAAKRGCVGRMEARKASPSKNTVCVCVRACVYAYTYTRREESSCPKVKNMKEVQGTVIVWKKKFLRAGAGLGRQELIPGCLSAPGSILALTD